VPTSDIHADDRLARLAAARLYLVCDGTPGERELSELLPAAIAGGVDIVQLRDKRLDDEELLTVARSARELCARHGALLIVNDRPEVARASGADGVHVGQDDMPVARVRGLVGPDMLIGLSTHAPAEIDAAVAGVPVTPDDPGLIGASSSDERSGSARSVRSRSARSMPSMRSGSARSMRSMRSRSARSMRSGSARSVRSMRSGSSVPDYIGVGPVHATPTKPGRPAVGLELVRYAAAHTRVPFYAIGGLDAHNLGEVLAAGASRVCVLRAIAEDADPERAARELRELLDAHPLNA
jgi:thiamine monophosphate synthase